MPSPAIIAGLLFILLAAFCRYDHPEEAGEDDEQNFLEQPGECNFSGDVETIIARALSYTQTTYCRLRDAETVEFEDGWDMSFQRFRIGTNSGSSGNGRGGACPTGQTDFEMVTEQADCLSAYEEDRDLADTGAQGGEIRFSGNPVLSDWFDYEFATHTLSSRSEIYIVRDSSAASYYKVQILSYYSIAGTPGYISFRYAALP